MDVKEALDAIKNGSVRELNMEGVHVGNDGAAQLSEELKNNTTVTHLDLTKADIGREGANSLAEMLKVNRTLTSIELDYNKLKAEGMKALVKSLETNDIILNMKIDHNDIGFFNSSIKAEVEKALARNVEKIIPNWLDNRQGPEEKKFRQVLVVLDKYLVLHPKNDVAHIKRARILLRRQAKVYLEDALTSIESAININPNNVDYIADKANLLTKLSRFDQALTTVNKGLEHHVDSPYLMYTKGNTLSAQGRYEEAIAVFDTALKTPSPYSAPLWAVKGTALLYLYKNDEAVAAYDKAVELNPKYKKDVFLLKASVLCETGKFQEAIALVDEALAIAPNDGPALIRKAALYSHLNQLDEGLQMVEKALLVAPNRDESHMMQARLMFLKRNFPEALHILTNLCNKEDTHALVVKAHVHLILNQLEEAMEAFDECDKINDKEEGLVQQGRALINIKSGGRVRSSTTSRTSSISTTTSKSSNPRARSSTNAFSGAGAGVGDKMGAGSTSKLATEKIAPLMIRATVFFMWGDNDLCRDAITKMLAILPNYPLAIALQHDLDHKK